MPCCRAQSFKFTSTYYHRFRRQQLPPPHDLDVRVAMAQAATFAGMGFGNAGVHVPHAVAYPIAGMVREYRPGGYAGLSEAMVPHGQSVIVTAPAHPPLHLPLLAGPAPARGRASQLPTARKCCLAPRSTSFATPEGRAGWRRSATARRTSRG